MKPTKPVVVGFLRGMLEAAVVAALGVATVAVTSLDLGEWAVAVPVIVLGIRTVEGYADQRIDPTTQRGRLGGAPAP